MSYKNACRRLLFFIPILFFLKTIHPVNLDIYNTLPTGNYPNQTLVRPLYEVITTPAPGTDAVVRGNIHFKDGVCLDQYERHVRIGISGQIRSVIAIYNQADVLPYGMLMYSDIHLADGASIEGGSWDPSINNPVFIMSIGDVYTLYLDGDVRVPNGIRRLASVAVDGQGHHLKLGAGQYSTIIPGEGGPGTIAWHSEGALSLASQVEFRNIILENAWCSNQVTGSFITNADSTTTIKDSTIYLQEDKDLGFFSDVIIKGTVRLIGKGSSLVKLVKGLDYGNITIAANSNLILENCNFLFGRTGDIAGTGQLFFTDKTSKITLHNATITTLAYPTGSQFPFTKGTMVVQGNSTMQTETYQSGFIEYLFGDGIDPANDFDIIIEPAATLNLASNLCTYKIQNIN